MLDFAPGNYMFTLPAVIRDMVTHAGKRCQRYALDTVQVSVRGPRLFLVATDGHRAARYESDNGAEHMDPGGPWFSVLIPVAAIKAAKIKPAATTVELRVTPHGAVLNGCPVESVDPVCYPDADTCFWKFEDRRESRAEGRPSIAANATYLADAYKLVQAYNRRTGDKTRRTLTSTQTGRQELEILAQADDAERLRVVVMGLR